jgi:hypothetical protein
VAIRLDAGQGRYLTKLGDIESPQDQVGSYNAFDDVGWGPNCKKIKRKRAALALSAESMGNFFVNPRQDWQAACPFAGEAG